MGPGLIKFVLFACVITNNFSVGYEMVLPISL